MYGKFRKEWNMKKALALSALALGFGISGARAQTVADKDVTPEDAENNCIRVELMMYSGRPRPNYLVCEEDRKEEIVGKLKTALENQSAGPLQPLESTPAYQGLLITVPEVEKRVTRHSFVGKGKVNNLDAKVSFQSDDNRKLESMLLELAGSKHDRSSPDRSEPLKSLVDEVKAQVRQAK